MKISYSSKFEKEYRKLPLSIKRITEKKEHIFRTDPFHSRLETHKLKGRLKDFWAFSINDEYRIIFEFISKQEIWFHSVGTHAIYKLWD